MVDVKVASERGWWGRWGGAGRGQGLEGVCFPRGFRAAGARGQAQPPPHSALCGRECFLSWSHFFCGHPAPPEGCDLSETPLPVTHKPALSPRAWHHGRSQ